LKFKSDQVVIEANLKSKIDRLRKENDKLSTESLTACQEELA